MPTIREEVHTVFSADTRDFDTGTQRVIRELNTVDKRTRGVSSGLSGVARDLGLVSARMTRIGSNLATIGASRLLAGGGIAAGAFMVVKALGMVATQARATRAAMVELDAVSGSTLKAGRGATVGEGLDSLISRASTIAADRDTARTKNAEVDADFRNDTLLGRGVNAYQRTGNRLYAKAAGLPVIGGLMPTSPFGKTIEEEKSVANTDEQLRRSENEKLQRTILKASIEEVESARLITSQRDIQLALKKEDLATETRIAELRQSGQLTSPILANIEGELKLRKDALKTEQGIRDARFASARAVNRIAGGNMGARSSAFATTGAEISGNRDELAQLEAIGAGGSERARALRLRGEELQNNLRQQRQGAVLNPDGTRRRAGEVGRERRASRSAERRLNRFDKAMNATGGLTGVSRDMSGNVIGGRDAVTGSVVDVAGRSAFETFKDGQSAFDAKFSKGNTLQTGTDVSAGFKRAFEKPRKRSTDADAAPTQKDPGEETLANILKTLEQRLPKETH